VSIDRAAVRHGTPEGDMTFTGFPEDTTRFLADLSANNEKAWFDANRARYEAALVAPAKAFVTALGERLQRDAADIHAEPRVGGSIFRINRDVRFSKDKRPYKDHLDLMFWLGEGRSRDCPGLFFRLTPDRLHLGGGMHGFDKDRLAAYRAAVAGPAGEALAAQLAEITAAGLVLGGQRYQRVPKGFAADHPRAELLKHDGLHVFREEPVPASVNSPALVDHCADVLLRAYPVVAWIAGSVSGR
jgi:uncharacterized protein (TIGR02453 family)